MATTTEFEQWLAVNEPEGMEEAYNLWKAADGDGEGLYQARKLANGQIHITGPDGDPDLALVSRKAQEEFKRLIERYNPHAELGWEGGLAFERGMKRAD